MGSVLPSFAQTWVRNLPVTQPTMLALDTRNGTTWLYVAEHGATTGTPPTGGGRILRFNLTTGSTTPQVVAPRAATNENGAFISPDGIVVDPATGDIFVADRYLNRVQRLSINQTTGAGTFVMGFGTGTPGATEMRGPVGLARDASGNIYVAEHGEGTDGTGGHFVSKWSISGTTATRLWRVGGLGSANGQFRTPYGIAVSGSEVYVSDGFNWRVQVLSATDGAYIRQFSVGNTIIPLGLTLDGSTLWVSEASGNSGGTQQVNRRNPATGATTAGGAFGTSGTGNLQFQLPFHAVRDAATNTAYVADYNNNRVQVISLATPSGSAPSITSTLAASVTAGSPFSYTITASNSPTSFTATNLPTGLSFASPTISGTVATPGTYNITIGASNSSGSDSRTLVLTVNAASGGDTTAPSINSFVLGPNPTSTNGVFDVTFSEPVTGVSADDFAIYAHSGTTGTVLGVTALSSSSYRVSFDYRGASGALQMAIRTSGTGIVDAAGNPFTGAGATASAPVRNLVAAADEVAPTVSSFTAGTPTSSSVTFTLTFSEAVTGFTSADLNAITTGTANATIGTASGSGASYTIPVTFTGTGTIALRVVGGATTNITDAIGNVLATATTSSTASVTGSGGGGTAPVIANQTATGTQNAAFSYQVVATGATSFSIQGTPALPAGLSMSSSGAITGTPTAAGTTTVTVRATNASGSSDAQLAITISPASTGSAPVITSATSASATVGTAFSYQIAASGSPTSYAATNLAGTGLTLNATTGAITGTPSAAGTITSSLTATNATGTSAPVTLTITVAPASTPAVPVVTPATVSGTAGTALSYQVVASNSPTSYTLTGSLPAGLSFNSSTGVIAGTPSAASSASVSVSATNAAGTSAVATITFNIAAAPSGGGGGGGGGVPPPPPPPALVPQAITIAPVPNAMLNTPVTLSATSSGSSNPIVFNLLLGDAVLQGNVLTPKSLGSLVISATQAGNSTYAPGSATMTINVRNAQTLTFNSPVSAIVINQPVTLSASSSANLPVTFSVVRGDATISGNTLTPRGPGEIVVRASQAGNDTFAGTSVDVNFGAPQRAAQAINFAAINDVPVTSGPITLQATSSSGLPITYTLVSGPATLNGNVLTLTRTAGPVVVRASQAGNDIYSPAVDVTRTINVRAIGQQVYLGTIGSDPFAVVVSMDNTKGMFITRFAGSGEAIVAKFTLNSNGTFTAAPTARQPRTITGTIANGTVTGNIVELNRSFTATVAAPTGTTASLAGVYVANIPGSATGETYIVVGPTGNAFAVSVTPLGVTSGTGTVGADGALTITLAGGSTLTANINANTGAISGTLTSGNNTAALVGLSEGTQRSDRLVNLSSRLRVVGGDGSRAVIAGFFVTGNEPKRVLVRAVGPGLTGFGVTNALANPTLQLFRGNTLVAENDDWSGAEITSVGNSVGAFQLAAGSRDAAIVATLTPGAYTAIVGSAAGDGVVLVEVYDASTNTAIAAQQLINISTRGFVETGEGNLIAGFVVSGNAPKRVLIRGIGPGLTQFNVPGALADPMLKVYAAGSTTPLAQNDDWGTAQPINATQTAATAAEITAASVATGGFPLAAGSKDAAIIVTLMPGQYSAVVSGANNATGAGLVEVYELSNF